MNLSKKDVNNYLRKHCNNVNLKEVIHHHLNDMTVGLLDCGVMVHHVNGTENN